MFEKKKRLELVDILRGAKPIQIDYEELKKIALLSRHLVHCAEDLATTSTVLW